MTPREPAAKLTGLHFSIDPEFIGSGLHFTVVATFDDNRSYQFDTSKGFTREQVADELILLAKKINYRIFEDGNNICKKANTNN